MQSLAQPDGTARFTQAACASFMTSGLRYYWRPVVSGAGDGGAATCHPLFQGAPASRPAD
eukprot:scaffold281683_cov32-Tisochrysis_lutea.AAC.1